MSFCVRIGTMKEYKYIICMFFIASVIDASRSSEKSSLESAEIEEHSASDKYENIDRDRRGTYGAPSQHRNSYNVRPPISPASHFSIFAAHPSPPLQPAKLSFHRIIQDERPYGQSIMAYGRQSLGFTPAVRTTPFRPVILSHQAKYALVVPNSIATSNCDGRYPCAAMVYCSPFFEEIRSNNLGCSFQVEAYGACCRFPREANFGEGFNTVAPRGNVFAPLIVNVEIQPFSRNEFSAAISEGFEKFKALISFEIELQRKGIVVNSPQRPAFGHLQFFRTSERAVEVSRGAQVQGFTSNALQRRLNLNPAEASFGLRNIETRDTEIASTCPQTPDCGKKAKFYRTSDGSCNNIYNPKYGQARTAFERILPPKYADGISEPRRSVTGTELPSARVVSVSNVADVDKPSTEYTLSVMQWGQFIDHDLAHTPIFRFGNESGIECCDENGKPVPEENRHPECSAIEIPVNDPFFSRFGRRCMNFVRSLPAPRSNCSLGFREQMNQVTHFLDGSAVYGSSEEEENELRKKEGGLLKFQGDDLLPPDRFANEEDCFLAGTGLNCFLAGDSRANEQPHLSVIHTIWLRQHNRLARELAHLNPHWKDETIFQETKRIVVAQIQHIVYNEWLPIILGTSTVENHGLLPKRDGFISSYDSHLNPSIRNEFATVAFRFGHTLVEGMLRLFNKNHQNTENLQLFEHFNRPRLIYQPKTFDQLLRGLFKQPMQSYDNCVVDDLTNRLFQTDTMPFGMDLIAMNTQRGRDHGVACYNDLREACSLPRANDFFDLRDFISPETIATFRNIYASVDDIDPFVAGISEAPVNGGVVGPTFNCLIRDQFSRLKFADRFFYENGGMPSSFTDAQLFEIRRTSWARIICDNSRHIKNVQPLAFRLPGPSNEKVPCSSLTIPGLNLTPWTSAPRERQYS